MDAARRSNRRFNAMVSIVITVPLVGMMLVGAIQEAGAATGSAPAIGPGKRAAAESEPTISTSVRILRPPGEPSSSTSLRFLPAGLGQPPTVLGDFAEQFSTPSRLAQPASVTDQYTAASPDQGQPAPTPFEPRPREKATGLNSTPLWPTSRPDPLPSPTLEQPSGVRWAFTKQPTDPPSEADATLTVGQSDGDRLERHRALVTANEPSSLDAPEEVGPAIPLLPQPDVPRPSSFPMPVQHPPLAQPTELPRVGDAAPMRGVSGASLADRYRLALRAAEASPVKTRDDGAPAAPSEADEPETLGEAPEETNTELQFLRRDSVLLDPGQYQIDVSCQYILDHSDFTLAEIEDDMIRIGEAQRRQRLLLVPLEFRLGVCQNTQAFVNVPFGWSNSELSFLGTDEYANAGGIGDVGAGITRVLLERDDIFPDVLGTLAFSAPTGKADIITSLSTPGTSLGEGFWTLTMDLTFIHTYDPVVLYYGLGYRHRFPNKFDDDIRVNPGKQATYRLGVGFAVNPRVTLSASFLGSYIGDDRVNDVRVAGGIREPMYLRFAATIVRDKEQPKDGSPARTVEPFFRIGMTDEAADAMIGVSWTR